MGIDTSLTGLSYQPREIPYLSLPITNAVRVP